MLLCGVFSDLNFTTAPAPSQPTQPTGGDIPSSGLITFPAPRQGQSQFVIRNSITGEVARLSSTTQTFALPISTFPVGPQEITVETERGEVLVRYQLVVPGKRHPDLRFSLQLHMCCARDIAKVEQDYSNLIHVDEEVQVIEASHRWQDGLLESLFACVLGRCGGDKGGVIRKFVAVWD